MITMTIGGSIFLIAVGAILKFAVTATVAGVSIQTIGLILMIAGAFGLLFGLFLMINRKNEVIVERPVDDVNTPQAVVTPPQQRI